MGSSVNKIPSRSLPFVDKDGRINQTWYEYLRKFIADSAETTGSFPAVTTANIIAGAGLTSTVAGSNVTLNVGAGNALAVNGNDVALDINSLAQAQGTLDDEIVISQPANNNSVKKTRLRDVAGLSSPGGTANQVQYNDAGSFGGNSGFTYNGSNSITMGALTVTDATFSTPTNATKFTFNVPAGTSTNHYTFRQTTSSGSSDMPALFGSSLASTDLIIDSNIDSGASTTAESRIRFNNKGVTKWVMGLEGSSGGSKFVFSVTALNTGIVYNIDPTNSFFNMVTSLTRSTAAGLTASTTQTQGQGALTKDINEVSTVANANDVRTLPDAIAGRSCLVINNGANTLQVFPASGDNLGAGLNTSTTIASGSRKLFVAFDSTNWEPVI